MPVSGNGMQKMLDWSGLFKHSHTLVEMQSRALAEIFISLIAEGFNNETDPYGRKWAPRKTETGSIFDRLGRKILHGETMRLRNGWHVTKSSRRGFHVEPSVPYAAYHQAPRFNRRPTRMMVPSGALGLPASWKRDMFDMAEELGAEYFGGKAPNVPQPKRSAGGGGGGKSHGHKAGKARAQKVVNKRAAMRAKRGNARLVGQLVQAAIRGAKRALR